MHCLFLNPLKRQCFSILACNIPVLSYVKESMNGPAAAKKGNNLWKHLWVSLLKKQMKPKARSNASLGVYTHYGIRYGKLISPLEGQQNSIWFDSILWILIDGIDWMNPGANAPPCSLSFSCFLSNETQWTKLSSFLQ